METVIKTVNLCKNFEKFSLENINLSVSRGSIVGLIGENGSGKTTLLRLLLNQTKRSSGFVELFEQNTSKIDVSQKLKEDIGFVLDECCFHNSLTAKQIDNIFSGIYKQWNKQQYYSLLTVLGIDPKKRISEYSKGMKNKIMLATALSHAPKLLILDEVTSGLDPVIRDDILTILYSYVKENRTTVIFSTHITTDIEKIANEIVFLHQGKIILQSSLDELLKKYIMLKCPEAEWNRINHDYVVYSANQNGIIIGLFDNNKKIKSLYPNCSSPSLEDIMLMHIRGVVKNDRVN